MAELVAAHIGFKQPDLEYIQGFINDFPVSLAGSESDAAAWVEQYMGEQGQPSSGICSVRGAFDTGAHVLHLTGLKLPGILPDTPKVITGPEETSLGPWDIAHLAIATCVGVPYGCDHTRGGRIMHDVFPVAGAQDNTAYSHQGGFHFHVDGAMDPPNAPDYFLLQCLRNREKVATFASTVEPGDFAPKVWKLLQNPAYTVQFRADHRPSDNDLREVPVVETDAKGGLVRLTYYDDPGRLHPDVRLPKELQTQHRGALQDLKAALERDAVDITLNPGDILVVDNARTVHGRRSAVSPIGDMAMRRWLVRLWVATDPQKVARVREAPRRVLAFADSSGYTTDPK